MYIFFQRRFLNNLFTKTCVNQLKKAVNSLARMNFFDRASNHNTPLTSSVTHRFSVLITKTMF